MLTFECLLPSLSSCFRAARFSTTFPGESSLLLWTLTLDSLKALEFLFVALEVCFQILHQTLAVALCAISSTEVTVKTHMDFKEYIQFKPRFQ